jgi:methylthioribose-1-phosphate isomerase
MREVHSRVTPLRWRKGLELLDQRRLPWRVRWLAVPGAGTAIRLIRSLAVRGAPAIGLTAAYALAVEARRNPELAHLRRAGRLLASARPTAANLARAVADVMAVVAVAPRGQRFEAALATARALHEADAAACRAIADNGAALLPGQARRILTHCNTGALATGGIGTALGIVRALHAQGRLGRVFACEARPVLQGARLTVWEAMRDSLPVSLLADAAAAALLASGAVDAVVVGADRIAADGSVANKIGTYALALAAAKQGVPFVVAAPTPTFDLTAADGYAVAIELRDGDEVRTCAGRRIVRRDVAVYNPAFDITPPRLLTAIVSERGVAQPVNRSTVRRIAS